MGHSSFPESWFAAGVVTAASAADFARYAAAAPDTPARAWRWAAARDWAEERGPLPAADCRALFALGAADPDANLGTALMCVALYQPGCPADVRAAAAAHPRPAVRRAAAARGAGPRFLRFPLPRRAGEEGDGRDADACSR